MKSKIGISIGITISMLLVVSVGSVIGTDQEKILNSSTFESPLFYTQTQRFTTSTITRVGTTFIGKDAASGNYGFSTAQSSTSFNKAFLIIQNHPDILTKILPLFCQHELIQPLLDQHTIQPHDIEQQLRIMQKNPEIFEELITNQLDRSSSINPSTLGLNSSNPLAILIVVLAVLPLLLTLVIVIATATIISCLNINGCFENLFNAIIFGFINGLKPAQ